jgi:hemolysin III
MTAGIALLALATLVVPVFARAIRIVRRVRAGVDERLGHRKLRPLLDPRARVVSAAGRRSPIPLPDLGPPLLSPRLAPAASAEPSRESRQPTVAATRGATTCDGLQRPCFRGLSHQIAFFAAVPAAVAVATHGGVARAAGTAFALSVAAMLGVSSMFHRGSWSPQVARRLGQLDHAMIYGLIAGTYAPIGSLVVHRGWRLPILASVWGAACLAATVKLAWARAPTWVAAAMSIALGWAALIVLPQVARGIGLTGTFLLLAGGIAYSAGAVVYVRQRPDPVPATFGYHEVFHVLVIAAVVCQYSTIVLYVLPPA